MKRDNHLDIARGIGITLVVFGHVQRGLHESRLLGPDYPFDAIDFSLYTFHMPLFFFLSGLHLWKSVDRGADVFFRSKLRTIVAPYFVWSIIQGAAQIATAGASNHPLHLHDWPRLFFAPIGQFWFLYVLLIWQIFAMLCANHRRFFVLITLFSAIFQPAIHANFPMLISAMGIFLMIGASLGGKRLTAISDRLNTVFVPVILLALFTASVYFIFGNGSYYSLQTLPSAVSGIALVISVSKLCVSSVFRKPMQRLGRASMDIYVMHIMAAAGMRIVLVKLGVKSTAVHLVVGLTAGIMLPLVAAAIIHRGQLVARRLARRRE